MRRSAGTSPCFASGRARERAGGPAPPVGARARRLCWRGEWRQRCAAAGCAAESNRVCACGPALLAPRSELSELPPTARRRGGNLFRRGPLWRRVLNGGVRAAGPAASCRAADGRLALRWCLARSLSLPPGAALRRRPPLRRWPRRRRPRRWQRRGLRGAHGALCASVARGREPLQSRSRRLPRAAQPPLTGISVPADASGCSAVARTCVPRRGGQR